jgi:hypothetical protein
MKIAVEVLVSLIVRRFMSIVTILNRFSIDQTETNKSEQTPTYGMMIPGNAPVRKGRRIDKKAAVFNILLSPDAANMSAHTLGRLFDVDHKTIRQWKKELFGKTAPWDESPFGNDIAPSPSPDHSPRSQDNGPSITDTNSPGSEGAFNAGCAISSNEMESWFLFRNRSLCITDPPYGRMVPNTRYSSLDIDKAISEDGDDPESEKQLEDDSSR